MDAARIVNWSEVVLWGMIGVCFLVVAAKASGRGRWEAIGLAVAFLAFGVSDYVELQTGAWWKPWWLLVWKVGCGAIFGMALFVHLQRKKQNRR